MWLFSWMMTQVYFGGVFGAPTGFGFWNRVFWPLMLGKMLVDKVDQHRTENDIDDLI